MLLATGKQYKLTIPINSNKKLKSCMSKLYLIMTHVIMFYHFAIVSLWRDIRIRCTHTKTNEH